MQNYSAIQKFLHDFVLKRKSVNKLMFEIEKIFFLTDKEIKNQQHIFITGLPRSGTTILLNFLYSSGQYASLTYKNMPFIMSPHFSKLFNKKKKIITKERLHSDGITFDINSPEALDEFFFNNDEGFIKDELINYIQLILNSENKNKYLSKNNLNYKRIKLINTILPEAKLIIPIREPLQHSYSLLNQHLRFSKLQKDDDFIRRYMNYLFHNEFGLDHKSWNNPIYFSDFNDINYWLEQWCLFYQKIINEYEFNKSCHFVVYEELCNTHYTKKLLQNINFDKIESMDFNYLRNLNKSKIDKKYSKDIYKKAKNLYNDYKNK